MVNTINPADAKPGEVYEGTVHGVKRTVLVRQDYDDPDPWESLSEVLDHEDVSDLVRLVPARPVTRDDRGELWAVIWDELRRECPSATDDDHRRLDMAASAAADAVVERLNTNGGVPVSREDAALADRLERQATSIARLQGELETAERDRSRWRRAHGIVEQERITARQQLAEAVARAETAETRAGAAEARTAPAVTREDVERIVHRYIDGGFDELHVSRVKSTTDAFMTLLSGDDPAVHVVRESDVAAVEVQAIDGGKWWLADGALVNTCESPTESEAQEAVDDTCAALVGALAVRRAIEAGQATDPVDQLAEQIESATREAIRQVCADLESVAPDLDPLTVERAMEVTSASRCLAAHVLGQEASDE